MAAPFFILDTDKLNSLSRLRVAARHNLREIAREIHEGGRIDPKRADLNRVLVGPTTSQGVMDLHKQLLADAKPTKVKKDGTRAKMRDDAVFAIEFMVSIPPDVVEDEDQFFAEVPEWIERRYGVPVLSATIHRDEAKPHMHCLVLPVKDGHMVGSDLIGLYADMHADFHRQVAAKHGLSRKVRLNAATRKAVTPVVMAALNADPALMQTPQFHAWLQGAVERDPEMLMELIGLPTERPPAKAWVETMTRPVPARHTENHIGFVAPHAGQSAEDQTLTCVRDRSSTPAPAGPDAGPETTPQPPASTTITTPAVALPDPLQSVAAAHIADAISDDQDAVMELADDHDQPAALPTVPTPQSDTPEPVRIDVAAAGPGHGAAADDEPLDRHTRVYPDDLPADWWDLDRGDHVAPPPKPASIKPGIAASVDAALYALSQARSARGSPAVIQHASDIIDGRQGPYAGMSPARAALEAARAAKKGTHV